MNVNGINNKNIIDAQSAAKVTEDLFAALSKKSVDYSKIDLSKFNRQTLGVDFYNQKTDLTFQRQIAIVNSGMLEDRNVLNAVQSLNSYAALQTYNESAKRAHRGEMTIDKNLDGLEFISKTDDSFNTLYTFETNKDKKDFNPFFYGNEEEPQKKEEK